MYFCSITQTRATTQTFGRDIGINVIKMVTQEHVCGHVSLHVNMLYSYCTENYIRTSRDQYGRLIAGMQAICKKRKNDSCALDVHIA